MVGCTLSPEQKEILRLIARGWNDGKIGDKWWIVPDDDPDSGLRSLIWEGVGDEQLTMEFQRRIGHADLVVFSECGFFQEMGQDRYVLHVQGIIDAVESDFGSKAVGTATGSHSPSSQVYVVHGRNNEARKAMFEFLRSIGLWPVEWAEALGATGKSSPHIDEVLDTAFAKAHAVVVLMTPDDEARLREPYRKVDDLVHESQLMGQARPNVLFEAGMAFGRFPTRTILVEVGRLRPFSDAGGRYVYKLDNSASSRRLLAHALQNAECPVKLDGTDWLEAGNFELNLEENDPKETIEDSWIMPHNVVEAFRRIPDFTDEAIEKDLQRAYAALKHFKVDTIRQLEGLVSSAEVFNTLRALYLQEFPRTRKPPFPLDPLAVANWGAALYSMGLTEESVEWVRQGLRSSDEYKRNWGSAQ